MSKTSTTPILNPGRKSREELERMFANRPLEPYIVYLSVNADFTPIMKEIDGRFDVLIDKVEALLTDSLHLLRLIKQAKEDKSISTSEYTITHEIILKAIASKSEEQIVENYKKIYKLLRRSVDYGDFVNEFLYESLEVIKKYPIVHRIETNEAPYEFFIMSGQPTQILINSIQVQINEIVRNKKTTDESWMGIVLSTLNFHNAKMDRKMFRDIYDFLEAEGFISEEQLNSHQNNTRQRAKEEFVKAAYFRMKNSGRLG